MTVVYSTSFASYQGLATGSTIEYRFPATDSDWTVVIRQVTFYWGSPSSVASNSAVVLDMTAPVGIPTIVSYDSGITGGFNPIYEHFELSIALAPIVPDLAEQPVFRVVNTSNGDVNVDYYVGGWVLGGVAPVNPLVGVPI